MRIRARRYISRGMTTVPHLANFKRKTTLMGYNENWQRPIWTRVTQGRVLAWPKPAYAQVSSSLITLHQMRKTFFVLFENIKTCLEYRIPLFQSYKKRAILNPL